MRTAAPFLVILSLTITEASAAPHQWKDATGKHTTEAEFIELDGTTLRLKRTDGKEISIPLERLAAADQIFALREAKLRAANPPELSTKGKALTSQLVKEVKAAADPYSLKQKLRRDDLQDGLAPALQALLKRAEELVMEEGRRSAVGPALTELLKDESSAVRAVAASAAAEFGDAAVSASPALVTCLDDKMPLVKELATGALFQLGESSDGVVPALLAALEKGSLAPGKELVQLLINAGERGGGPNLEIAVPRLGALVTDGKQDLQRRVLAAYALNGVLNSFRHERGFDPRLRLGYNQENVQELFEQQRTARSKLIRKTSLPLAEALPAIEDPRLAALTFTIVATDAPDDLKKMPPQTLVALVEKFQDIEFDDELGFHVESPLQILESLLQRKNLDLQLSTQQSLKLLASENDSLRRFGQAQLLRAPQQTRKILPEIAQIVRDGKSSEVRGSALTILMQSALRSADDFSALPIVPIRIKSAPRGPAIELAGKSVADAAALTAAIGAYKPARPAEAEFDIEKTLKDAATDEDGQMRYMAMAALASRGTDTAKKTLQDLSRTALKEETRELARRILEERQDPDSGFEGRERGEDSPFEPGKKKEKRGIIAELTLDPDLRMEPLLGLLASVMDSDVQGTRVVLVSKEGKRQTAIDLIAPNVPQNRQQLGEPFMHLKLGERAGSGRIPLEIRLQHHEARWRAVPSPEALRFLIEWQVGSDGRRDPDFRDEMMLMREFHRGRTLPIGSGALPYVVSLTAAPTATLGDCAAVLEALGVSDEGGKRDDLIQWIRLTSGERSTSNWFMKVGSGREAPPEK